MEAKYTLIENTYIDNNDAIYLAEAGLTMGKDANEDIAIISNSDDLVKDDCGDYYIDTTNFTAYEFDKTGETLVSDKINNDDLKMLFELFNANEESTMKTITIELKEIDYKDIEKRAAKNGLSIADYIMKMYENQTNSFTRGIMLDDAIDQAIFECEDVDTVEVVADEINTMVECKVDAFIEYLGKN